MTDTTDIAALREALCKLKSVEGLRTLAAESIDQLEAERQRSAEITEQYVDRTTALSFAAQRAEAAEKSNAFLKEQLAQQANFNPDWDMLEACRESWREVVALLKEREAELEAERLRADDAEKERGRIDRRNAELNSTLERWSVERAENANEIAALKANLSNPVVLPKYTGDLNHETTFLRGVEATARKISEAGFTVKGE